MRLLLLFIGGLVGCSGSAGSAGPPWRQAAPAKEHVRLPVFADAVGVWRCDRDTCERVPFAAGAPTATLTLPCDDSREASPEGTWIVIACDGEVLAVPIAQPDRITKLGKPFGTDDHGAMTIDDRGVVTVTDGERRLARHDGTRWQTWTLDVPRDKIDKSALASVVPATGRWLGYSDGAYADEVAWSAAVPDTPIKLGGGALVNRDRLWISKMTSGYAELTPSGEVPLPDGPRGGAPGHGIMMERGPWGPDGVYVQYEDLVRLFDAKLRAVHDVALPNRDVVFFGADPTGTQLYFMRGTGEVFVRPLK